MQREAVVSSSYLDTGINAEGGCCILSLPGYRGMFEEELCFPPPNGYKDEAELALCHLS
jgi:hypothetical protein